MHIIQLLFHAEIFRSKGRIDNCVINYKWLQLTVMGMLPTVKHAKIFLASDHTISLRKSPSYDESELT